jgi:hypothetical protein
VLFYWGVTWSFILQEEDALRMFVNNVLNRNQEDVDGANNTHGGIINKILIAITERKLFLGNKPEDNIKVD